MINSHSASTFAQITHRGVNSISDSFPTEIGICYTPIPISSIRPVTSAIPGDNIPRCSICSAFFNKFNTVEKCDYPNSNKFRCSLCGELTTTNISLEIQNNNNAECLLKNEVYEALVHRSYFKRKAFIPTDFYIFSLDLLRTNPTILDIICNSYSTCYQPKQVGIAFIHGAITVVKFRPSTSLQTFCDEVPIVKESQLFASAAYFRESIPKLKSELLLLKPIENIEYVKNFIQFGISVSTRFGSSLRFILNDSDFHNVAHLDSLKFEALNMCTKYSQASVCVFSADEIKYRNPLFDLVSFTGGFFKVIKTKNKTNNDNNITDDIDNEEISSLLTPTLYHDSFLFIRPPDCGDIIDYAGYGFLKTNTGVSLAKVQAGDTFYFTINGSKVIHPFIQFVIYYTTANNERRIRVTTLSMMSLPIINTELIRCYATAMVAQRIIAEDFSSASEYLKSLKKKFSNFDNQTNDTTNNQNKEQQGGLLKSIFTPISSIYSYLTNPNNSLDDEGSGQPFIQRNEPNVFDKANEIISYMNTEKSQYLDLYCTCIEYRSGSFLRRRIQHSRSQSPPPLQQQQQNQKDLLENQEVPSL